MIYNAMEVERVIEQLSIPMSFDTNGLTSESGSIRLGLSQDSSAMTYSSSNSSWMSESSCGCHSPRPPLESKSQLMFYNHCILPPLLCTSSRTEMQVYKKRAVEKEQKRRRKHKSNLVTKVETILSDVNICGENQSVKENEPASLSQEESKIILFEDCPPELSSPLNLSNKSLPVESKEPVREKNKEQMTDEASHSSASSVDSKSEEDVYRHSLRNLLEKSVNMSEANENISLIQSQSLEVTSARVQDGGCENFHPSHPAVPSVDDGEELRQADTFPKMQTGDDNDSDPETVCYVEEDSQHLGLNQIAEELVKSVLEAAELELTGSNWFTSTVAEKKQLKDTCLVAEEESPLQSCSVHCPYYSPRSCQSNTSPCKAAEHIDRALDLLENELAYKFQLDERSPCTVENDSAKLTSPDVAHTSFENAQDTSDVREGDVALLIGSQQSTPDLQMESVTEFCPVPTTDGEVHASPVMASPASHDSLFQTQDSSHRIRTGSFSIEHPSELLLSSRSTHTIYSEDEEKRRSDVKRRLDMNSDSDESLLSTAITDISLKSIRMPDKATVPDYCRLLEEKHQREMIELQKHHQFQLQKYKEKYLAPSPTSTDEVSTFFEEESSSSVQQEMHPGMHVNWCKLSALIKGHLTRKLLTSQPVQSTMQTIRDTSRTILSMRSEDTSSSTNMSSIQDATLMNRLFSQLRSAMYEFHAFFFKTSISERLEIIVRSQLMEAKIHAVKNDSKPRLSAATLKSLQRKREERKSFEEKKPTDGKRRNPQAERRRIQTKEIQSKISSIWKSGPTKKKKSNLDFNGNARVRSNGNGSFTLVQS